MSVRRILLRPLAPIYGAVVGWKRRLFETGRLPTRQLKYAVISVGSVSAGGAGKTPVVLLLADMLQRRGYAVRILTRGYGREGSSVEQVDPAGDVRRFGDEPVLLARRSGAPVYVGANRFRAGRLAEDLPGEGAMVHLLDDGFQHRQLRRDLDIVLLTRRDVEDVMLPAGNLREPVRALRKADVIVLREEEAEALGEVISSLRGEDGRPVIWQIRRRLDLLAAAGSRLPKRPLVFCGIARPESFTGMLEAEGSRPAATVLFGDHHHYEDRDISRLVERARRSGADGFFTTEKDAVKLKKRMRAELEGVGPVVVPELHVELVDEQAAVKQMIALTPRLDRRRNR